MVKPPAPGRGLLPAVAILVLVVLLAPPGAAFPEGRVHDREFPSLGNGDFVLADVNGDGWTDLAAVDDAAGSVRLYLGGPLGLPINPQASVPAPAVRDLAAGDLDGDGHAELLATDGARAFWFGHADPWLSSVGVNASGGRAIASGDLNGDAFPDLAVLSETGAMIWFQRPATRGFGEDRPDLILSDPLAFDSLAIGDVTGDGLDDLVLAKPYKGQVYVQGAQGLDLSPRPFTPGGGGGAVSVAIVDGGGEVPWVVVASSADPGVDGSVGLWRWSGDGLRSEATLSGTHTARFAVGDVNDDRRPDLTFLDLDGSLSVFLQRTTSFGAPVPDWVLDGSSQGTDGVAVGDVNGDGFADILLRTWGKFFVYLQEDAAPSLIRAIPSTYAVNRGAVTKAAIDLREFFRDDHDRLTFELVSQSDPAHLRAAIDGTVIDFEAADWFGTEDFRVSAWDGNPNHVRVVSNVFTVLVNDVPVFASTPPRRATAGQPFFYVASAADAYPTGDTHTFALAEAPAGMDIDPATGLVQWMPTDGQVGTHAVAIEVRDAHGGYAVQEFSVVVAPAAGGSAALLMAVGIAASSAALMAAAALINENAKWAFLLFFLPLYTKIKRERVLDHFVRGQIFGYVQANPGEHYNAIKDALGLTNGSLAHHLRTLEREQFIKSKRFGLYRRFYPMNYRLPPDDAFQPNDVQQTILAVIRDAPGITQKEIAQRLGLTPPTVNYHIGVLSDRKLIRVERRGRSTHCTIAEGSAT